MRYILNIILRIKEVLYQEIGKLFQNYQFPMDIRLCFVQELKLKIIISGSYHRIRFFRLGKYIKQEDQSQTQIKTFF